MAKAAAKKEDAKTASAPAPAKGKGGKAGKVARQRTEIDDLITLMLCVGSLIWACHAIIGLSAQGF